MFCSRMKRRFYVKIELDLHAVSIKPALVHITCPGVWLCPSGYLEATIKSLGYFFKTGALEPKFPVLCHDQFVMEGYFKSIGCYAELERTLGNESIDISLWQTGRRLAYFSGKLGQIMQPAVPRITCFHNVNVQILMVPSSNFPGIIAPKLEISARAIIQDKESMNKTSTKGLQNAAPALIPCFPKQTYVSSVHSHDSVPEQKSQKPVCHTKKDFKWHRTRSFVPNRSLDFASRPMSAAQICKNCSEISNGSLHGGRDREGCGWRSRNRSCCRSSSYRSCSSSKTYNCHDCADTLFCRDDLASEIENDAHSKDCGVCESYRSVFKDFRQFMQ